MEANRKHCLAQIFKLLIGQMRFKKLLANPGTKWLYPVAILAVGLLAYTAVLIIGIPSQINLILSAPNSTFLFIGIVLLLYLAFCPSGWIGIFTSFSATLGLFAVQLSSVWSSSHGDFIHHYVIGGLLPMNDAHNYYVTSHSICFWNFSSKFYFWRCNRNKSFKPSLPIY